MKPNGERARAAVTMVCAVLVIEIITIISTYLQYDLLDNYAKGVAYTDEQLGNNDLRVQLVMVVYWVFFIMSGIIFIMWFRRAYFNLHQLGRSLQFSEAWAVGSWFVPILSFFRPFMIMKELFNTTELVLYRSGIKSIKNFPMTYLGLWWVLWLLNNIMVQILKNMTPQGDEFQQLYNESLFYIAQSIVSIFTGILVIKIILAYDVRERLLHKLMAVEDREAE